MSEKFNQLKERCLLPAAALSLSLLILSLHKLYDSLSLSQAGKDFSAYWASARLLLSGQNPYLSDRIFALQTSVGWTDEMPLVMYNPPWVLTYILPFSTENYVLGKFLWLVVLLGCMIVCTTWLWRFYGGTKDDQHWNLVILLTYAPAYFVLVKGQIVPFILFGIAGFMHFEQRKSWFLAGTFVCLLSIKPHALYLFFVALVVWVIRERRWDVMLGAGGSVLVVTAIPFLLNREILSQYYTEIVSRSYQYDWCTPTLGYFLRSALGREHHYIQYSPMIVGLIWLFCRMRRITVKWVWAEEMPLLLFMSLMTTFYIWVNDYLLLMVPIIQVALRLVQDRLFPYSSVTIVAYALINVLAWITAFSTPSEEWIIWMPPVMLIGYLLLKRYFVNSNAWNPITKKAGATN